MPQTQTTATPAPEFEAAGDPTEPPASLHYPACSNSAEPCFTWQSADLLQGNQRIHIAHNGGLYQLQTTRQGKLILTK